MFRVETAVSLSVTVRLLELDLLQLQDVGQPAEHNFEHVKEVTEQAVEKQGVQSKWRSRWTNRLLCKRSRPSKRWSALSISLLVMGMLFLNNSKVVCRQIRRILCL